MVLPRVRDVGLSPQVEEAGAPGLSRVGVRLVLHGDLPDHSDREQAGLLGDLPEHRRLQVLAGSDSSRGDLGTGLRHADVVEHELSDVHKIIWRGPYIKAPVGAPMLAAEKVYSVE
jgi:hypothetical protein